MTRNLRTLVRQRNDNGLGVTLGVQSLLFPENTAEMTESTGFVASVASVAAAIDVQIVCNREPVDPVTLSRHITTLLK